MKKHLAFLLVVLFALSTLGSGLPQNIDPLSQVSEIPPELAQSETVAEEVYLEHLQFPLLQAAGFDGSQSVPVMVWDTGLDPDRYNLVDMYCWLGYYNGEDLCQSRDTTSDLSERFDHGELVAEVVLSLFPEAPLASGQIGDPQSSFALIKGSFLYQLENKETLPVASYSMGAGSNPGRCIADWNMNPNGVFVAAGVGNFPGPNIFWPACNQGVVRVGSVEPDNKVSSFSSGLPEYVDIFAPGYQRWGTFQGHPQMFDRGTSASTPVVSGVAAAMLGIDPSLQDTLTADASNNEILQIMQETAAKGEDCRFEGCQEISVIQPFDALVETCQRVDDCMVGMIFLPDEVYAKEETVIEISSKVVSSDGVNYRLLLDGNEIFNTYSSSVDESHTVTLPGFLEGEKHTLQLEVISGNRSDILTRDFVVGKEREKVYLPIVTNDDSKYQDTELSGQQSDEGWIYYWDEECVCTDGNSWKSLRDQPGASNKAKCQNNPLDLKQACKNVHGSTFSSVNTDNLTVYWDEECVKTDNEGVWEKVQDVDWDNIQGASLPNKCKNLNGVE
jgi:hypothetical protein